MSRHRSARPRYGRILLATASLVVTLVAVLGGVGVVPTAPSVAGGDRTTSGPSASPVATSTRTEASAAPSEEAVPSGSAGPSGLAEPSASGSVDAGEPAPVNVDPAPPAGSGSGRRVVFSETEQRVWLVRANGTVGRTHLVSGSLEDNLDPGTYAVYSTSRWAVGIDDSGVMEFFVRFTRGQNAAIGFHTIPTKLGVALQTRAQLGTPQSHGCIRQARADAIALWRFAPEGTKVVVV